MKNPDSNYHHCPIQPQDYPFVSVVIPVFNDEQPLKACLEALAQQTYPHHHYEIVVVDNGSDDLTAIETTVASVPQAILIQASTPGSYAARNRGIERAKGEIIAFTDADCIPASDWIEQGVQHLLATPNCGMVAGRIELLFRSAAGLTPVELYESMAAFSQKQSLERYKGSATANLFTFRSVIETVGLFNATLKSGGDFEWGKRVYQQGYQQVYAESACVSHPARSSFRQLQRKVRRVAGGVYDLYVGQETSLIKKNKAFFRLLYNDLNTVYQSIFRLIADSEKKLDSKLKVILVILLVGYTNVLEKIRLKLGKASTRA